MNKLGIGIAYYNTPGLLEWQKEVWSTYSQRVKDDVAICVVDDHSPTYPIVPVEVPGLHIEIYRLANEKSKNWIMARNLAADKLDTEWILFTDMDHTLLDTTISKLFNSFHLLDDNSVYTFEREVYGTGEVIKSHGASYLMKRSLFWKLGGYDERCKTMYHHFHGMWRSKARKTVDWVCLDLPLSCIVPEFVERPSSRVEDYRSKLRITRDEGSPQILTASYKLVSNG